MGLLGALGGGNTPVAVWWHGPRFAAPAVADHTDRPATVTLVGSLQDEVGCDGDWAPAFALASGRPVGRDRIVALLWPESSTERARHQLSDTLYILRGGLGADVVRAAGDELVLVGHEHSNDPDNNPDWVEGAKHVQTKFNFQTAATDASEVLEIGNGPRAVLIATRHHLHAPLVKAALDLVSSEMEDAANILGAGTWTVMRKVSLLQGVSRKSCRPTVSARISNITLLRFE